MMLNPWTKINSCSTSTSSHSKGNRSLLS